MDQSEKPFTEQQILGGYAFKPYEKELMAYVRERYKELSSIAPEVKIEKVPKYKQTEFTGELLSEEARKLSPSDIAILADNGNLCFGGTCSKYGDRFSGCYFRRLINQSKH